MDVPPASHVPSPVPGLPDRQKSRVVVAVFLAVVLGWMAFRVYSPYLLARPTEPLQPPRRVDLNTADRTELMQVPGIGPVRADAILAHRADHGPFKTIEDIEAVRGIGGKTREKIQPFVGVQEPPIETLERKPTVVPVLSAGKIKPGDTPINVNTATLIDLQRLPGVGPVMAQRILDTRLVKRFESIDELRKVPRLGVKTLDGLRPFVTVK